MNPECQNCKFGMVVTNPNLLQKMMNEQGARTIQCGLNPPCLLVLDNMPIQVCPLMKPTETCGQWQSV